MLLCSRGYISWRLLFPKDVGMVPPIRIVSVVVWGIGCWLVLTHCIGLLSLHVPL